MAFVANEEHVADADGRNEVVVATVAGVAAATEGVPGSAESCYNSMNHVQS